MNPLRIKLIASTVRLVCAGVCAISMLLPAFAQTDKAPPKSEGSADQKPLNEQLTAAAWDAFNKDKFQDAVAHANKCIDEFLGAAKRAQAKLEGDKASIPTGQVSEVQKKAISENGLLNDVATCLFVKGRALEKLGRKEEAKKAFEATKKLSFGRCWDPKGSFWSPAEGASDRLSLLE